MYQIEIGVYIGSDEAAFSGIFCSTLIYRNKCLDFRGSLQNSSLFPKRKRKKHIPTGTISTLKLADYGIRKEGNKN